VDEQDARRQAERLNETHPQRARFQWLALARGSGIWAVVRAPRAERVDPLTATTEAKPKPPEPDDPRTGPLRGIPPYG
jgi:hypothetical protein